MSEQQQQTLEKEPKSQSRKKPKKVALRFNPYLDGCRDIPTDSGVLPPLRRRRFAISKSTNSGADVKYYGITLRPQPQLGLDGNLWEELKQELPQIQQLLRKGAIEEYFPVDDKNADSTLGYSMEDITAIIEATTYTERLQNWAKTETRSSVVDKINQQLEDIEQGNI